MSSIKITSGSHPRLYRVLTALNYTVGIAMQSEINIPKPWAESVLSAEHELAVSFLSDGDIGILADGDDSDVAQLVASRHISTAKYIIDGFLIMWKH